MGYSKFQCLVVGFLFTLSTFGSIAESADAQKTYQGDFHYLIGDLSDSWSRSDYDRFYLVAKNLSEKGIRTVIHVDAKTWDLKNTLTDPLAVGIIWNSHGSKNGSIWDADEKRLPRGLFARKATDKLRYVLFANCYGQASIHYYGLDQLPEVFSKGWPGDVSSEMLFHYLFSQQFERDLKTAMSNSLR